MTLSAHATIGGEDTPLFCGPRQPTNDLYQPLAAKVPLRRLSQFSTCLSDIFVTRITTGKAAAHNNQQRISAAAPLLKLGKSIFKSHHCPHAPQALQYAPQALSSQSRAAWHRQGSLKPRQRPCRASPRPLANNLAKRSHNARQAIHCSNAIGVGLRLRIG